MKARSLALGARLLLRHGWPRRVVTTYVGLGDELMTAGAIRELDVRGRAGGTWFLTRYPELWRPTRLAGTFLPWDPAIIRLAERLRRPVVRLGYSNYDAATDYDKPLPGHAIATFCRQLGVRGRIELKPFIELTPAERKGGRRFGRQVVVQNSAEGALIPMSVKRWPSDRWDKVSAALRGDGLDVIQLGSPREPALDGAIDLRGRTTVREAAAILAESRLFVGLVGGLMHLARAVDCPAVIVYGGREDPALAGYGANTNLVGRPPCSPCYFRTHCPHDLVCMDMIGEADVVTAARDRLMRAGERLPVDTDVIQ